MEVYLGFPISHGQYKKLTVTMKMWMTLNCIHIFIVTGSFLYRLCVMRPASQRFFIHSCIYLRIWIISYLATFLGTNSNSLYVLMCRKAVNQSINLHDATNAVMLILVLVLESQVLVLVLMV